MKIKRISLLFSIVIISLALFSTNFSQTDNLLLWNKLGSQAEIENSEYGPDGSIYGSGISFSAGYFDNGFTSNGSNTGPNFGLWEVINPDYDLAGTVEFWWRPQRNYNEGNSAPDEVFLSGLWGNPMKVPFQLIYRWREHNGLGGIEARVHCTDDLEHVFRIGKVAPFNAGDWVHIAFVWDIEGIHESGDPIFFGAYVDGIYYPFYDVYTPGVSINYRIEKRIGAYLSMGYYNADWGVRLEGILDNIKVWNYAKTDFSNRFLEAPTIAIAIEVVKSSIFELVLPQGTENSLIKSLENSLKSLDMGNTAAAINQLEALINKIEAQRGKKLSEEDADDLISTVELIVGSIENNLAKNNNKRFEAAFKSVPNKLSLLPNYPNPFNPQTNIMYTIPKTSFVILKIYNIMGEEVNTLVSEIKEPGSYQETFSGAEFSSGIYYCVLKANNYRETIKMILLK